VVVRVGARSWSHGITHIAPVAPEGLAENGLLMADRVCEEDDGTLLAGPLEVVPERRVLGEQGVYRDSERVLEHHECSELRSVHQVRDGRRCWRRGGDPARASHAAGASEAGALPARSAATCWR